MSTTAVQHRVALAQPRPDRRFGTAHGGGPDRKQGAAAGHPARSSSNPISAARITIAAMVMVMVPTIARANETVTYGYDAKGRLVEVAHGSGPASGVRQTYAFDLAGNRTGTTVTGAPLDEGAHAVVVVPLHGMSVIILPAN